LWCCALLGHLLQAPAPSEIGKVLTPANARRLVWMDGYIQRGRDQAPVYPLSVVKPTISRRPIPRWVVKVDGPSFDANPCTITSYPPPSP
jgi:hypothetical protein